MLPNKLKYLKFCFYNKKLKENVLPTSLCKLILHPSYELPLPKNISKNTHIKYVYSEDDLELPKEMAMHKKYFMNDFSFAKKLCKKMN